MINESELDKTSGLTKEFYHTIKSKRPDWLQFFELHEGSGREEPSEPKEIFLSLPVPHASGNLMDTVCISSFDQEITISWTNGNHSHGELETALREADAYLASPGLTAKLDDFFSNPHGVALGWLRCLAVAAILALAVIYARTPNFMIKGLSYIAIPVCLIALYANLTWSIQDSKEFLRRRSQRVG